MKLDPLFLIGGTEIDCGGVSVRQPRLDELRQPGMGFEKYYSYLNTLAATKDDFADSLAKEVPAEVWETLTVFQILSALPPLRALLEQALSFFLGAEFRYREENGDFACGDGAAVDAENYDTIRNVILQISGIRQDEVEVKEIKSKKARAIYEKILAGRKQKQASKKSGNKDLQIPNVISAVAAKCPGYNLINIWELTVWQLYDQFGRVNVNNQVEIVSHRWAAWGKDDFDYSLWYKQPE